MALNILRFLANSPEKLERLMEQSGMDLQNIRARAGDRDFLVAVVDFLMTDEELLVEFCQTTGTAPQAIQMVNHVLEHQ